MGDATVYHTAVDVTARGPERRQAERNAVMRLVAEAFGRDAAIGHDAAGAPFIIGKPDVYISVSHCPGVAVLAVSRRVPIGIDAEWEDNRLQRIAARFLSADEHQRFGGSLSALAWAWTAKEAAFKALGIPDLVITQIAVGESAATARGQVAGLIHRAFGKLHITLSFAEISPQGRDKQ